ncbi:hypothetical protein pdul_cds_1012 [Pandoravirus dulcis]|uniref:Uncharacterized protein n=1 Tax=Pandoravirus dulcis TaxID=1349409 RepID=S4VZ03_9VIRU|nr:hypothetical protein pdul_cds_1012 [Pandoravirus dulcis]AGO83281.1 hypothetical protein pdul_cds_1012 [Pandoravirus dulcis]
MDDKSDMRGGRMDMLPPPKRARPTAAQADDHMPIDAYPGPAAADDGWRVYTRIEDWTPRRLVPHYDADLDEHHHEVDVTAEHALWCAYVRSGSRVPSSDLDVVFDDVVAFAGDFIDDDAYYDMDSLEPGLDRRRWVVMQPPAVQSDRARRSRLATVVGEALDHEDSDLDGSASDGGGADDDMDRGGAASDDAASSCSS